MIIALAIMALGIVTLIQLFSGSLRTTKKTEDYTKGLIYARSVLEEANSLPDPRGAGGGFDFEDGYRAEVDVSELPSEETSPVYEIKVTVTWPPSGRITISSRKTLHGNIE